MFERSTDTHAQRRSNPQLIRDLGLIDSLHILQVLAVEGEQAIFLQLLVIVVKLSDGEWTRDHVSRQS